MFDKRIVAWLAAVLLVGIALVSCQPAPAEGETQTQDAVTRETQASRSRQTSEVKTPLPFEDSEHREPTYCLRVAMDDSGKKATLSLFVTSWRNVGSQPREGHKRVETDIIDSGSVTIDGVWRYVRDGSARVAVRTLDNGRVQVDRQYQERGDRRLLPIDNAGKRFTVCQDLRTAETYHTFYRNTPSARADRERPRQYNERQAERARIAKCNSLWRQMERATRRSVERELYREWRALDCTINTLD